MSRKKSMLTALSILLLLIVLGSCGGNGGDNDIGTVTAPTVITRSGAVSGVAQNDVNAYLGVPFAAPPVGDRR